MKRRRLLQWGSLLLAGPGFALPSAGGKPAPGLYLSAASDPEGRHWLKGFNVAGATTELVLEHSLPERAHHIACSRAAGLFVVVARRPGRYLLAGDLATGKILHRLRVPEERHLFGHGVFSADGRYFHAVENDYRDTSGDSGRVVCWEFDRRNGSLSAARVGDFPSHGVGPHELAVMPDGDTLVVANGGIRTHPRSGREKLNLDSMQPSLVYIDRQSGELLEKRQLAPEFHQASIRHLDVNGRGDVALAMQHQGPPFEQPPLVALHSRGGDIRFPEVPPEIQRRMNQYCGSVRFDDSGRYFAVSCPRGNMITFWDGREERFIDSVPSRDGCGVCASGGGFLHTAGTGRIDWYDLEAARNHELAREPEEMLLWDNHLTMTREQG